MTRRHTIRHQPIATACRETPGEWVLARAYATRYTALSVAYRIRTAYFAPYRPAGAFEAELRTIPDGDSAVYVRYLTPQGSQHAA
jgi:hypothetical protein